MVHEHPMSEDQQDKLVTTFSLESIKLMERRRDELAAERDGVVDSKELLLLAFIIEKLKADFDLHTHLAKTMQRIDSLEKASVNDREIVEAVLRDAAETRRLTLAAVDQVQILGACINAALDELGRVSDRSQKLADELVASAAKMRADHEDDDRLRDK
jgi:hypothetical protein